MLFFLTNSKDKFFPGISIRHSWTRSGKLAAGRFDETGPVLASDNWVREASLVPGGSQSVLHHGSLASAYTKNYMATKLSPVCRGPRLDAKQTLIRSQQGEWPEHRQILRLQATTVDKAPFRFTGLRHGFRECFLMIAMSENNGSKWECIKAAAKNRKKGKDKATWQRNMPVLLLQICNT